MSEIKTLTWNQLEFFGQLTTHTTPGNITKDKECPTCGGNYVCSADYTLHLTSPRHLEAKRYPKNRSKQKLTSTDLDKLPWRSFRKGNGEWIFSNVATYLLEAIRNGTTTFGNYHYWTYGDGKFIARRRQQ